MYQHQPHSNVVVYGELGRETNETKKKSFVGQSAAVTYTHVFTHARSLAGMTM